MVEIRTVKMVEQTEIKFIADDGKEFIGLTAKQDCETYERQRNKKAVESAFERLDAKAFNLPILKWFSDDYEVWKIVLESKKDYFAMIDYFKVIKFCYDIDITMPDSFPCTMTLAKSYEYVSEYCGNLKEELCKLMSEL